MENPGNGGPPPTANMLDPEVVVRWSNAEVLNFLSKIGAEHAAQAFQQHNIEGRELASLDVEDMRYMQVPLGPARRIINALADVKRVKQQADDVAIIKQRNRVVKEWEEFYGNFACMCLKTKKTYKLTGTSFYVVQQAPAICCGGMSNNNMDLSTVKDVDNHEPGCSCSDLICGKPGYITVQNETEKHLITTKAEDAKALAELFRGTWELSQLQSTSR